MGPRTIASALPLLLVLAFAPGAATAEPAAAGAEKTPPPRTTFDWYGYVKLDASYDSSLIDPGDFARWVASDALVEDHGHFNMTARQTRLGVRISKPGERDLQLAGRIEIDFYGSGTENKNEPQLRHAYVEMTLPRAQWVLIAGQTSDLLSPLNPATVNYSVAWWAGNIGFRRPQFRATRRFGRGDGATSISCAISRTIGDSFGSIEPGDSGADSGLPTLQAAISRSWNPSRPSAIGLSGHWGRERIEESASLPAPEYDSWSAGVDVALRLGQRSKLEGEIWTGANLDDYLGGIGQGVNLVLDTEVAASGGWLSFSREIASAWTAAAGVGLDDPRNADLSSGARARNFTSWLTGTWRVRGDLDLGLEASYWDTDYRGQGTDSSYRLQAAVTYRF